MIYFETETQLLTFRMMSYFETETQLLTFRKDILPHEFVYHLIFQNMNGSKKVEWGDGGVKSWTFACRENFEF